MRKVFYSISICLVLLTPFLYSNELYNGVISAKQIWFYGAMAFLMLVTALDLLFDRKPLTIQLNKIDLALLAFFTYYTIRAATTPYMPLLHNQRWINWGLCVVLYFVVKRIGKIWTDGSHSRANGGQALSGNGHTIGENSHTVVIHGHTVVVHGHTSSEDASNDAQQTSTPENHLTTPDNCMAMPDAQRMTTYDNIRPNDTKQLPLSNNRMTTHDAKRMTTPDNISLSSYIINFLILTALCQSLWGLLQLYGFLPSFNGYFKITGTFFNPAPYAMYLAIIFPMALGKVLYYQHKQNEVTLNANPSHIFKFSNHQIFKSFKDLVFKFPYYIAFATVLAILLILPATMIRAAWLAAAVGALVVAWPWLKTHTPLGSWLLVLGSNIKYKIIAITAALVLIGAIGTGLFYLKKDSASGKLFIWEVTLGKIAQKPLFGYGVGRFEAEYNNWQAEYFMKHPDEMDGPKGWVAGNTNYAFNEFLEITSETGLVGLMLFLGLLRILVINRHSWSFGSHSLLKTTNDASQMTINAAKQMPHNDSEANDIQRTNDAKQTTTNHSENKTQLILSFSILALLSFPFYNLPLLLLFFIILAIISANMQVVTIVHRIPLLGCSFALVLLIQGIWLSFALPQRFTIYKIWQEANNLYYIDEYEFSEKKFAKIHKLLESNNEFLQQYGKCLAIKKDYEKAKFALIEAKKFGGDYILYTNLGDVYKELKQYAQAEMAYKFAITMIPHKLYPNFLLAKLFVQRGDSTNALLKAKKILAMDAKVSNMAEEEIKQKIKEIINEIE